MAGDKLCSGVNAASDVADAVDAPVAAVDVGIRVEETLSSALVLSAQARIIKFPTPS